MRAIYAKPPDDEKIIQKEIRRIARSLQAKPPQVIFWFHGDGKYEQDERAIYLPNSEWWKTYEPDLEGERYWLLVIHELAHYLDDVWHNHVGHDGDYYSIVVALGMKIGIGLDRLHHYEKEYKPMAWKRGTMRAAGRLLESHKEKR